ncbi:pseudouridine synthase [Pseudomonas sp. RIT-PI-AD]|uniref:pseudouridine synthase n=1 Tax=Pseudomonas sp. RIT-PI-AD TaxID=3035294 RepID=UPI0021D9B54C|nr:pseudouridine synthase [Pseudomonas sp. RIT-PI-AD]
MTASPPFARPAGASTLHLPQGEWTTLLECLCAHFPAISRARWLDRFARGRVLDAQGMALAADHPYKVGLRIHYFREVDEEAPIPFDERVLHLDAHLLVVDKPHFLPVMPSGSYVEQTLLARLMRRLDNPHLVPIHRIDRLTAGLVLFSVDPASRDAYQALFRERRIDKTYEAIAPALPELDFPYRHRSRLVPGEPFFRMTEASGEPNSETLIEVKARQGAFWHYRLHPVSGRKHQLRVHMAALGAPICGDPFYPRLLERHLRETDDYRHPLKLLARSLTFVDPLDGRRRHFDSGLTLDP